MMREQNTGRSIAPHGWGVRRRNVTIVAASLMTVAAMVALTYAAVPLYRLFCQVTGFAGTPQIATASPGAAGISLITVRFTLSLHLLQQRPSGARRLSPNASGIRQSDQSCESMMGPGPARWSDGTSAVWLTTLRRYFVVAIPAHFVWEAAQLPLYTIWYEETSDKIAFAVLHCTGGDALIAGASLLGTLLLFGSKRWPDERYIAVAAPAVAAGLAYTMFSEWYNTEVRGSWTYSSLMPTLPGIGTGLSPLLQWVVSPIAAFWWAQPRRAVQFKPVEEPS